MIILSVEVGDVMTIGEKIRYYRELRGLTQEDIAKRLNTKPQNIYKYEKGIIENIPLPNIVAMANIFGVSPADLAGWGDLSSRSPDPFKEAQARQKQKSTQITLSNTEAELIRKYRAKPEYREAIHRILGITEQQADIKEKNTEPFYYSTLPTEYRSSAGHTRVASPKSSVYDITPKKDKKTE